MFRNRGEEKWFSVEDGLYVDFQVFSEVKRELNEAPDKSVAEARGGLGGRLR